MRHVEYDNEILTALNELQEKKRARIESDLAAAVQATKSKYESQPGLVVQAQKLR